MSEQLQKAKKELLEYTKLINSLDNDDSRKINGPDWSNVDSWTPEAANGVRKRLIKGITEMGLDPKKRDDLAYAFGRLFNIEIHNMPEDFDTGKYILTPTHVSEFDGPIHGVLFHQNPIVVAKEEWTVNQELMQFLSQFMKFASVDRTNRASAMRMVKNCAEHLNSSDNGIVIMYPAQTIVDFKICEPQDITATARAIQKGTGASILPVYGEQPSFDHPTRYVFGEPIESSNSSQFSEAWLRAQHDLSDSLKNPEGRLPIMSKRHSVPPRLRGKQ